VVGLIILHAVGNDIDCKVSLLASHIERLGAVE